jgi:hypothetical protein
MTSPTHQRYVNKIVLTKNDQLLNRVNESTFLNQFNLGSKDRFLIDILSLKLKEESRVMSK